jgi:hypothetical protein
MESSTITIGLEANLSQTACIDITYQNSKCRSESRFLDKIAPAREIRSEPEVDSRLVRMSIILEREGMQRYKNE